MKNAGKTVWLDRAIPEIPKHAVNDFMLLSWDFLIKYKKNLPASILL